MPKSSSALRQTRAASDPERGALSALTSPRRGSHPAVFCSKPPLVSRLGYGQLGVPLSTAPLVPELPPDDVLLLVEAPELELDDEVLLVLEPDEEVLELDPDDVLDTPPELVVVSSFGSSGSPRTVAQPRGVAVARIKERVTRISQSCHEHDASGHGFSLLFRMLASCRAPHVARSLSATGAFYAHDMRLTSKPPRVQPGRLVART
jgi:hypothetical protein